MLANYWQRLRRFGRNVRLLLVFMATVGFSYFGIYSLLFNLYLLRLGYGPEQIGLINGVGYLAYALSGLPAAALDRRLGSRRSMIAGVWLSALATAVIPVAEWMPAGWQLAWLLAANTLSWLGSTFFMVSRYPFLTAATTPEVRDYAFSVQLALLPLAGFVGSLVGGALPGLFSALLAVGLNHPAPYRYPLLISGLIYFVIALPALGAASDSSPKPGQAHAGSTGAVATSAPYGLIALLSLVMLLRLAGESAGKVFFNVYLDAELLAPISLIGTLSAVGQLVSVPAALATPLAVGRLGKGRTLVWGTLGTAISLLPLALLPHWATAGLGLLGVMASSSITGAALIVYSQESVPPGWRPAMSGAINSAWGLGSGLVAFGGGFVVAGLGYRSLFLMGAAVTLASTLVVWAHLQRSRGRMDT